LVLAALIAVAAVANLGLAVANVALPSIGKHFDASQVSLNLVAVGYSLGLAASVLYFSCGPWVNTRTQPDRGSALGQLGRGDSHRR
jgi:MFS family permease